ncbi:MAG: methylmalonyl-CoA epimerase [bacterium]
MIKKIDHIGIAVADLEAAMKTYEQLTGKGSAHKETVVEQQVITAFVAVGEVRLELLKGISPNSIISRFVEKRGEGVHHICFEVEDLEKTRVALTAAGMQFVENVSSRGAGGSKVAFIHPKSTSGVLVELVEYPQAPQT